MNTTSIIRLDSVSVTYNVGRRLPFLPKRHLTAVDHVNFSINPGETVGVIGESGCGKSSLGRILAGLEHPSSGTVYFDGVDVKTLDAQQRKEMRRSIQVVFQDPAGSLNPRKTVQQIVEEPFEIHPDLAPPEHRKSRVKELLETVGLQPEHAERLPHELSGGQQQRVGIARALAVRPRLLICDEAVSALDVSVRAQVVNLLRTLQDEFQLSYLFIAHDLQVVRNIAHRVMVMYLGKIVEIGETRDVYEDTAHPYTNALLAAAPELRYAGQKRTAEMVDGDPPTPLDPPAGCRFNTRCAYATEQCAQEPPLEEFRPGHRAACFYSETVNASALRPRAPERSKKESPNE